MSNITIETVDTFFEVFNWDTKETLFASEIEQECIDFKEGYSI